jgi:RNA-directed DNA polymerase
MTWYRQRRYVHFDSPQNQKQAEALTGNPDGVARHGFFPFLGFELLEMQPSRRQWRKIKRRPILIASHKDTHIFAKYSHDLRELHEAWLWENKLGRSVLAFRSSWDGGKGLNGKCNIHFARHAFRWIKRMGSGEIVGIDVAGFFDNISHSALKSRWAALLGMPSLPPDHYAVFKNLTKFSSVGLDQARNALGISKEELRRRRLMHGRQPMCTSKEFKRIIRSSGLIKRNDSGIGIPQGAPISATLSNILLSEFDSKLSSTLGKQGGFYLRYCDDILIGVPDSGDVREIEQLVRDQLGALGLQVAERKTERHRYDGERLWKNGNLSALPYLGFNFDGGRVLLRQKTLLRFQRRLDRSIWLASATARKKNRIRVESGERPRRIFKRKIFDRFSHLGVKGHRKTNFIGYGIRAAKIFKSSSLKRQVSRQWWRLQRKLREVDSKGPPI